MSDNSTHNALDFSCVQCLCLVKSLDRTDTGMDSGSALYNHVISVSSTPTSETLVPCEGYVFGYPVVDVEHGIKLNLPID